MSGRFAIVSAQCLRPLYLRPGGAVVPIETPIIPLMLKPCGFLRDSNLAKFQAANAPARPLIMLSEGEQEAIYDSLASEIERAVGSTAAG